MADKKDKPKYLIEVKGAVVFVNGVQNFNARNAEHAQKYAKKYAYDRKVEGDTAEVK